LLCYRTDAPFEKLATPEMFLPDGQKVQVEILGDGQQFVAFGTHPATGAPYSWGDRSPLSVPLAELPVISRDLAAAFIAAAQSLLVDAGARVKQADKQSERPRAERTSGDETFFSRVNRAALDNLASWFLTLFPKGRQQGKCWRVSSEALGRPLEEDLSFHPDEGGRDFGPEHSVSPIDAVIEHGGAADAVAAALWLCREIGVDPTRLGWRGKRSPGSEDAAMSEPDLSLVSDELPPPAFDWEAVPEVWRTWVAETAEACAAPPDYVFAALLAIGSAALGNARRVTPKGGWIEPPHLWAALVGNPSSNKTPALAPFIEAARRLERAEEPDHREALSAYARDAAVAQATEDRWKSEIKEAVKAGKPAPDRPAAAEVEDVPPPPRLVVVDSSTEEIQRILAGNPKGLALVRDELSGLIGGFDRYGGAGADRGFYLETWNGGRYVADRVKFGGKPLRIPFNSLAIVGGTQPDKLAEVLRGADDGLAARFLYIWPRPVPPNRGRGEGAERRAEILFAALNRLRQLNFDTWLGGDLKPRLLGIDDATFNVLFDLRTEVFTANQHDRGLMAGWRGKNPGRALRIALTLELLAWAATGGLEPERVSEKALRQAADYIDYCTAMMTRVMGEMTLGETERHAASVARWILRERPAEVNGRQLSKLPGFSRLRDPSVRTAVFERLAEAGWMRRAAGTGAKGRKPDTWTVNPLVFRAA
jgi:hypothetical protein